MNAMPDRYLIDMELAYKPKALATFAFYWEAQELAEPQPSYLITRSNIPDLPIWSNVSAETLLKHGVDIPLTPIYRTWVFMNRPTVRKTNFVPEEKAS